MAGRCYCCWILSYHSILLLLVLLLLQQRQQQHDIATIGSTTSKFVVVDALTIPKSIRSIHASQYQQHPSSQIQNNIPEFNSRMVSSALSSSSRNYDSRSQQQQHDDIYAAVHRKEYEIKKLKQQHKSTTDPIRMAMMYAQESQTEMKVAKALRRVYDDPYNIANPDHKGRKITKTKQQPNNDPNGGGVDFDITDDGDIGSMRRGSIVVDIKRKSLLTHPHIKSFCSYDDASIVTEVMIEAGVDAVMINTDYVSYGGTMDELQSSARMAKKIKNGHTAIIMKDIIVDEFQLGLAKYYGADGIVLMSCILGPSILNFIDLATTIGLETIIECHTKEEVEYAMNHAIAPNILINNYDRINQLYYPNQAIQLAGLFPGSGGPIISLATGGIDNIDSMKQHLNVGYDSIVIGKSMMTSPDRIHQYIRTIRDRTLLPAELSHWNTMDAEFDTDGNYIPPPTKRTQRPHDAPFS